MKTFFMNLAGCVVKIQLAKDINISDSMKPFLFELRILNPPIYKNCAIILHS